MQSTENAAVQVRLSGAELVALENWRRAQEKIPPRSEAIREAIRRLVRAADDTSDVPISDGKHRHPP
jgi:metal-responsive CopG/Arc/MetJ family transcriptional regulator